jgi:site-specific DNA-methyltransferase (adenine-specific)
MLELNKLYNTDCMEAMKDIPNKYFELAIVDPPYGLDKSSLNGSGKLKHRALNRMNTDWDIAPTEEYFNELFRISQNQIIWGGNYFNLPPSRGFVIWDKKQYMPTFSRCEYAWLSMSVPSKIYELNNSDNAKIHPTQKPVALYKWLLANYATKGDKILDTHVGSGSSLIACYDMGFEYMGFEIDKEYYEAASKRIEDTMNQVSFFNTGIL